MIVAKSVLQKISFGLALFGAMVWGHPVAAKTVLLSPRSSWFLEMKDDRCVLSREFRMDDRQIFVQFARFGPTDDFAFNLIGRPFGNLHHRQAVRIRFGPTGTFVSRSAIIGDFQDLPMLLLSGRLDNLDMYKWRREHRDEAPPAVPPSREAAISSMEVRFYGLGLRFELGSLAKPMSELRTCTDDLFRSWGIDPVEEARITQRAVPIGRASAWFHRKDFPPSLDRVGKPAALSFRLLIDAAGVPTSCAIQERAETDPLVSRATCDALLKRARFLPARRADGTPVVSYFIDRVTLVPN